MLAYSFIMTFLVGLFFGVFLLGSVFAYLVHRDDKRKSAQSDELAKIVRKTVFDQDAPITN